MSSCNQHMQDHIYYKVYGLSTVQSAKTEITDYKYAAVEGTQKRQEGEKAVPEKDENIKTNSFSYSNQ